MHQPQVFLIQALQPLWWISMLLFLLQYKYYFIRGWLITVPNQDFKPFILNKWLSWPVPSNKWNDSDDKKHKYLEFMLIINSKSESMQFLSFVFFFFSASLKWKPKKHKYERWKIAMAWDLHYACWRNQCLLPELWHHQSVGLWFWSGDDLWDVQATPLICILHLEQWSSDQTFIAALWGPDHRTTIGLQLMSNPQRRRHLHGVSHSLFLQLPWELFEIVLNYRQ